MYTQRLEDLAKQGDATAQIDLALCYLRGDGIAADLSIAIRWLTQSAEQGSTRAQALLCRALQMRASSDLNQAMQWGERAVGAGDLDAHVYLSQLYVGTNMPLNAERAEELLGLAAYGGHGKAQYHLGRLLLEQSDNVTQLEQGVHWLNQAAKSGDSEAVFELSRAYKEGLGIAPNQEMASRLLKEAAHGGSGRAQAVMAVDYLLDEGPEYWLKGLHWLCTAKQHPEPEVKELIKEAVAKLITFAEAGPSQRQYFLAERYKLGDIVEANAVSAFNWCKLAAEGDWMPAALELARMYETGCGTAANNEIANSWREKAAVLAKNPPPVSPRSDRVRPAHITPSGSFPIWATAETSGMQTQAKVKTKSELEGQTDNTKNTNAAADGWIME